MVAYFLGGHKSLSSFQRRIPAVDSNLKMVTEGKQRRVIVFIEPHEAMVGTVACVYSLLPSKRFIYPSPSCQ